MGRIFFISIYIFLVCFGRFYFLLTLFGLIRTFDAEAYKEIGQHLMPGMKTREDEAMARTPNERKLIE